MFDFKLELVQSDLYAMSPKYTICKKCNASYKTGTTCAPCALMWATVAQLVLETTKAYNASWYGKPSNNDSLPS